MEDGKKGSIIVNGQEIAGMKKGDKTIILQDVPGGFNWDEGQFDAFNADQMRFEAPEIAGFPRFSPDAFAFDMPEPMAWDGAELRAMQEKLRSGKFNQQLMKEYALKMEEFHNSDEWQANINEEIARMSADQERMLEDQQLRAEELRKTIELSREKAMQDVRRSQENIQKKMEIERQQIEKERQKKQRSPRAGSM
ncbi:MAG: hypothetical protein IPM82_18465 [Saprospiraceae bacterium]|nr:hypothetical protein [Saprospiraceae bacterium]